MPGYCGIDRVIEPDISRLALAVAENGITSTRGARWAVSSLPVRATCEPQKALNTHNAGHAFSAWRRCRSSIGKSAPAGSSSESGNNTESTRPAGPLMRPGLC